VWGILLVVLPISVGVLLFIHRGDAEGAARIANREIEYLLEPGETIERRAPVMQRHWYDYFRVTHGIMAATDRRLLYVGVPPEEILPREPEPLELEQSSYPYDRPIFMHKTRVFLGTLPGVALDVPGDPRTIAVSNRQRAKLDSVLAIVTRRQSTLRSADERERQSALEAAVRKRQPVFHTVQRGEALELIAKEFGVSVDDLRAWNGIVGNTIRVGASVLVKPWT
jgi:LysM repeat protein